jgi:hypothetical protein
MLRARGLAHCNKIILGAIAAMLVAVGCVAVG